MDHTKIIQLVSIEDADGVPYLVALLSDGTVWQKRLADNLSDNEWIADRARMPWKRN